MMFRTPWLLVCALLTGCIEGDAQARWVVGSPYERPGGWSSECLGRLVFDAPTLAVLGAASKAFGRGSGTAERDYSLGQNDPFGGVANIALVRFRETTQLKGRGDFKYVWMQADDHYEVDLARDGGPSEERVQRRNATQKLTLPNDAFIWRHKTQFDFGTLVESDMRARMLHGELSGEGSLAQAKAVVDALWPRYRPRKPGEMPGDPGICTPYGFLADPPKSTERDYDMAFSFPDPRHSNLVLGLSVTTLSPRTLKPGQQLVSIKPENMPTPWDEDQARAREEKAKCRPQQGTASRDLFGCTFAGITNIKAHREVEYLTLSNGQRARLLVMEYRRIAPNDPEYEVRVEAPGEPNSATRPEIAISATGMSKRAEYPGMTGKEPPSLDEAVKTVRTIAASLRLRPGAIRDGAAVKDTLDGVR